MTLFEKRLASTCGVAMVGIKTSNLMCCKYCDYENIHGEIEKIATALAKSGISVDILHDNGERILLLVYRKDVMKKRLSESACQEFLSGYGYGKTSSVKNQLEILSRKFDKTEVFPHEIGIFLGYPIEDINGFIKDPSGCKYCGVWKVYGNVEENIKLFEKYKKCGKCIMNRIARGHNLERIFGVKGVAC